MFASQFVLLILSAVIAININVKAIKCFVSKYDHIRQLYPKVSQNDAMHWRMADNDNYRKHPCKRECMERQPMTCYYYMVVHYDDTMSSSCKRYLQMKYRYKLNGNEFLDHFKLAKDFDGYDDCKYADGTEHSIMVVNGQLPGQAIEVCYGDTIVADVINSMHEMTTVHWHGIHQSKTPHMDGVPQITQYPIEAGQAYRYNFEADHIGTNWWHSHQGHQRSYGLAGPLIVRVPKQQNPHIHLYDFDYTEHTIIIQDWVDDFVQALPVSLWINGRGRNLRKNINGKRRRPTLYAHFLVVRGGRYRFRVIYNGVSNCPISFSIDKHDLIVIASDGNDIEQLQVQRIMFYSAERYDFVLHANQDVDNYWIRVKGYSFCEFNQLHQEAILHYQGARAHALKINQLTYAYERQGITLNELNGGNISLAEINAIEQHQTDYTLKPHNIYYTSMNVEPLSDYFRFQMDDISFAMPKMSLLQTRNLGIGQFFCNKSQQAALGLNCRQEYCQCSNIINVPAFKYVEFVITSKSISSHPVHLHGYTFRVIGMGVLGAERIEKVEQIDRKTPLPRRISNAPLKDSVQVPPFGYTIIRFTANSPGYWIFHCHISPHSENGMAVVLRVGEDMQMKMCPVSNCGLCSSVL